MLRRKVLREYRGDDTLKLRTECVHGTPETSVNLKYGRTYEFGETLTHFPDNEELADARETVVKEGVVSHYSSADMVALRVQSGRCVNLRFYSPYQRALEELEDSIFSSNPEMFATGKDGKRLFFSVST